MNKSITLSQITTSIFDGKHGDCENLKGSGLYFISVKDLSDYNINYYNAREITPNDFEQNYKRTNLEEGDTIYANTGDTIGKSIFVKNNKLVSKTSFQKSIAVLKPNINIIEPRYLYYLMKYETPRLRKVATGSGQKNLLLSTMRDFKVTIHDRKRQKQICSLLGLLDDKIEINNKINDELENMAKTIYDYWFLQFEFPNEEGKPYKSSGGKMVWNEELKREIPKGWTNGLISDLGEIISGGTPSKKHDEYYSKNGIAWVTPYDLSKTTDKYITHGEKDISQKGLEKSSAKLMPKGSILLTSRAPIGYIGISSNEVTTNQGFKSIVPYNKSNSEYIYYLLKSIIPYLKSLGNGSTFAEISKETLSNIPIVIPNKDIIDNFNNKVIHLGKIREIKEQENRELTSLRDFLLPLLMNGQVGFKENKAEG